MQHVPHLYHYAKRIACTLVKHPTIKPMVVKEEMLFAMAKKKAMEDEQDRLVREMMERIEYVPKPKVEKTYEYYLFDSVDIPSVEYTRRVMYG